MKKVAIIAPSSQPYTPYLRHFEELVNDAGISYDKYYWDRFHINEENTEGRHFRSNCPDHGVGSVWGYLGYRRFLMKELEDNDYSLYIILSTQIGIILYRYLQNKRFILDIRDFSHENNSIYRFLANRLIKRAEVVTISSDGFRTWLPTDREYLLSHNVSLESLSNANNIAPRFDPDHLVVSYIGAVSYYNTNVRIINAVSSSNKIHLRYIGSGTCERDLERYCLINKIGNVEFLGRYTPSQKLSFYENTDFVLSCYGNNSENVRSLTPNRLYESCALKRPIIVNKGVHLANLVERYGIGLVINVEQIGDLYQKLREYTEPQNYRQYIQNCNHFLNKVRDDIDVFRSKISNILRNI